MQRDSCLYRPNFAVSFGYYGQGVARPTLIPFRCIEIAQLDGFDIWKHNHVFESGYNIYNIKLVDGDFLMCDHGEGK